MALRLGGGAAATPEDEERTIIFSYGSNSTAQLRNRTQNPTLATEPARLRGFLRVFALHSNKWGGGVASIAPAGEGDEVLGSAVALTASELERLDSFETGYRKVEVEILAGPPHAARRARAITYVAGTDTSVWTPELRSQPSEAYLVAIHGHLREHWPAAATRGIAVRSFDARSQRAGAVIREWVHPGGRALSLAGACVEVALQQRGRTWKMPHTIGEVAAKLEHVGVNDAETLRTALADPKGLNTRLKEAGQKPFSSATLGWLLVTLFEDVEEV